MGLAWGGEGKAGHDELESRVAGVSVGLGRVTVSDPGGIDLEVDLAV